MKLADGSHLSYCTNIHPGETWDQIESNLHRYLPSIKQQVSPRAKFGVGLRLSAAAAETLGCPERRAEFHAWLHREGLYVFTLNGFPYGPFHGQPVKAEVYRPDWRTPERVAYTRRLADLLAEWLPEGVAFLWPFGSATMAAGAALAVCIIAYDIHHKGVAWSPCLMGACRALAYLVAGFAASAHPEPRLYWAALALASYVAGLSFAAKQENLTEFRGAWPLALLWVPLGFMGAWLTVESLPFLLVFVAWTIRSLAFLFRPQQRDVRHAVEGLIAGIALVDADFAAESGSLAGASLAVMAFALTHYWQRHVPGT